MHMIMRKPGYCVPYLNIYSACSYSQQDSYISMWPLPGIKPLLNISIILCVLLYKNVCSVFSAFVVIVVVFVVIYDVIIFVSPLDSTNNIFSVTVDVGAPEVTCQFLNGPVTSATCTIEYGTDPAYVNLPNTDSSSGIKVINVTVPLSTPLQGDTFYYYVVSSMGVQMQGTFHTGKCNS